MPVPSDLYAALSAIPSIDLVADTKAPDGYSLPIGGNPSIVYYLVSDVPDIPIGGAIAGYLQRWTVSVRGLDLDKLRAARSAVIAALHGHQTSSIHRCDYEGPAPLIVENGTPAEMHSPIDFLIYTV